jgi:hypothetical protein
VDKSLVGSRIVGSTKSESLRVGSRESSISHPSPLDFFWILSLGFHLSFVAENCPYRNNI